MFIARVLVPAVIVLFGPSCVGDDVDDAGGSAAATSTGANTSLAGETHGDDDMAGSSDSTGSGDSTGPGGSSGSAGPTDSGGSTGMGGSTASTGSSTASGDDGQEGPSDDGVPPDCAAIDDCEACGAETGCGWCGATGTCAAGDEAGPTEVVCSGGWVIEGDFFSCPAADCFARTSCGECQDAFSGCGWCASNNTCMPGAPDMPAPGGTCADQQWYFDICPADCADEMTCVSCTTTVGCGWCPGGGGCAAGTDAGPLEGACGSGWSTEVADCF